MKIIKRDGREVPYDCEKIRAAITAANAEVDDKISDTTIGFIVGNIEKRCRPCKTCPCRRSPGHGTR